MQPDEFHGLFIVQPLDEYTLRARSFKKRVHHVTVTQKGERTIRNGSGVKSKGGKIVETSLLSKTGVVFWNT